MSYRTMSHLVRLDLPLIRLMRRLWQYAIRFGMLGKFPSSDGGASSTDVSCIPLICTDDGT